MAHGWQDYPARNGESGNSDWPSSPAVSEFSDDPTPKKKRIRLGNGPQIRNELAKVYKGIKSGEINPTLGAKLVYTLSIMSQILEREVAEKLHERLNEVEGKR